jgi:N-methylhydantoinase B
VILTARHELLATAESLPIHVLRGPDIMARTMAENHPSLKRGDAFLHNSPYHGCTHPADHSILVPVVDDDGIHASPCWPRPPGDCATAADHYMGAAKGRLCEAR